MALEAYALTTVAAAKDELGIKDDAQNPVLERLIHTASSLVARHCNRVLHYEAALQELVPGYGRQLLFLSRTPVVSVATISLDGTTVDSSTYSLRSGLAGLVYREAGWEWTAGYAPGLVGPALVAGSEAARYLVTYAGGYVTPVQASGPLTRNLPYELEQACLYTVVHMHRLRGKPKAAMVETADADKDVWAGLGIPEMGKALLQPHVRVS